MSVKGAGTIAKFKVAAIPKMPKLTEPVIKGPPVAKFKAPSAFKIPSLPSLTVQARRGLTPKLQLAKAAAGASATTSKRNPNYPTP